MLNVGVIRGGISREYDESLETGQAVLNVLREKLSEKYTALDILLDRDGALHLQGLPASWNDISSHVDVIFNALHGDYGEDGQIQAIFDMLGLPYTGSDSESSKAAIHRISTKEKFESAGIKTPRHLLISKYDEIFDGDVEEYARSHAIKIHQKMPPPWVIKPVRGGDTVIASTLPMLIEVLKDMSNSSDDILIEEFIFGDRAKVGVVEGLRNQDHYTFLPVHIKNGEIFDSSKWSTEEKNKLAEICVKVHRTLGLSDYSESDFILHPKGGIYFIKARSLPLLSKDNAFQQMLEPLGISFSEFIDHLIIHSYKK